MPTEMAAIIKLVRDLKWSGRIIEAAEHDPTAAVRRAFVSVANVERILLAHDLQPTTCVPLWFSAL